MWRWRPRRGHDQNGPKVPHPAGTPSGRAFFLEAVPGAVAPGLHASAPPEPGLRGSHLNDPFEDNVFESIHFEGGTQSAPESRTRLYRQYTYTHHQIKVGKVFMDDFGHAPEHGELRDWDLPDISYSFNPETNFL